VLAAGFSVCLLYAQFTCLTRTNVLIPTQLHSSTPADAAEDDDEFLRSLLALLVQKVPILTQLHSSTPADAAEEDDEFLVQLERRAYGERHGSVSRCCSVYLLY
jgi:hypothetical protein